MLTVTVQKLSETVMLRCQGRLVHGEESALLCAAVRHHGQDLVVDLRDVTTIDAAGIGALLSLQAAGVYLKLLNPNETVGSVLRLTGLDTAFEICEGDLLVASPAPRQAEPACAGLLFRRPAASLI